MNSAYLHLALNHIPVVGAIFAIALLVFAIVKKSEEIKKVSLWAFVILALVTIPVYLTGEPAEEMVEHLPGVSESIIHTHEDAALLAMIAMEVLGAFALMGLILSRKAKRLPAWVTLGALALSLAAGGLMARTANLGGEIRHPEIRDGGATQIRDTETRRHGDTGRGFA
ncbi:MAG: hypothetical protein L0229_13395 [Blastocatellia bacterium]|nr:hypothetical protein [Blastocatellia bacterium]